MSVQLPHVLRTCGRRGLARLVLSIGLLLVTLESGWAADAVGGKPTLYYIAHTHWEGAVFQTREGYLEMGFANILQALKLLETYPDYKFTLDQVAYFKPFLERYPEQAAAFRKFIAQGRLAIVGGMDVMCDDVKPGGELFVRQLQYGKLFCREKLGVEVTTGWFLDTFGHHPQMPQLLRLAGYHSFWFCRGVPNNRMPSEFRWQGIDGTQIPAFWLPGFYGLFYSPPRTFPQFARSFEQRFDSLTPFARGPERVGLAGADVSVPEDYVPPLIHQFNDRAERPFTIRYAVPADFEAVVAKRPPTPVVTNDFDPIFQGTYSSRIELKQTTRFLEQQLLTAEKLGALAAWLGKPGDNQMIWRAWEPVLFNQTHDLASGVMTDIVYEDTVRSYDFAERLAEEMLACHWEGIAAHIDTRGAGVPVAVFNPLGWPRSDAVEIQLGFAEDKFTGVKLVGPGGAEVPVQIEDAVRYGDGSLKRVRLAWVATEVPALGYSVYRAIPLAGPTNLPVQAVSAPGAPTIENEFYRVTFDGASGAMTSLFDKAAQVEVLGGPANVVARETDHGDLWELYRGLDGASFIAMTNQQARPRPGQAVFSSDFRGTNGAVQSGPVYAEFSVSHPFANGSFATRVRLTHGLRRIDIETQLVNQEKYVRYQALFPTRLSAGRNIQEIPFGALERPVGIEFPAQNWVDYSDGERGLTLLNQGLPGHLVSEGTLMLSLLRSHNLGHYGYGGGYEPGMSSETGFELGQRRTFHYALVPHGGDWRQVAAYRQGLEFNQPLLVRKATAHSGTLPPRWSWLEVSPNNVVFSALTRAADGALLLRVYEAAGQATANVKLQVKGRLLAAYEANLLGDPGRRLKVQGDGVRFDLHPFEIKTVKLKF